MREEISEDVKLSVPESTNFIEFLRQLRSVVALLERHVMIQTKFVPSASSIFRLPLPPRSLDSTSDVDMGRPLPAYADQYANANLLYIMQHRCFGTTLRYSRP